VFCIQFRANILFLDDYDETQAKSSTTTKKNSLNVYFLFIINYFQILNFVKCKYYKKVFTILNNCILLLQFVYSSLTFTMPTNLGYVIKYFLAYFKMSLTSAKQSCEIMRGCGVLFYNITLFRRVFFWLNARFIRKFEQLIAVEIIPKVCIKRSLWFEY
jgi:hypothetical protein